MVKDLSSNPLKQKSKFFFLMHFFMSFDAMFSFLNYQDLCDQLTDLWQ